MATSTTARDFDRASSPSRKGSWAPAFAGFFLLLGAWAVAAPYNGTPDEQQHVLRAATVVTGQVAPRPSAVLPGFSDVDAPASLNRFRCWQFNPSAPASCAPEPGGDTTVGPVPTAAGRYHPLYYAMVGWPLALAPNWAGVLLARLISAALCAALLSAALTDALRWSRGRLAVLGVLIAATPMVAQMGGALNPNGLEIASGVALFAAGAPLFAALRQQTPKQVAAAGRHHRAEPYTTDYPELARLLAHVGLASLGLAMLRAAGPIWLLVALMALLVPFRRRMMRGLWEWRAARMWIVGVGVAALASIAWTAGFGTADLGDYTGGRRYAVAQAVWVIGNSWPAYLNQAVGIMSWLDTPLPGLVYLVWQAAASGLIILALLLTDRAGRWRLAALAVAGVLVPTALIVAMINTAGFFTQGRYLLPVLVGLPIVGAYLIAVRAGAAPPTRTAVRLAVAVLLPLQVGSLAYTMVRWQSGLAPDPGIRQLNPFAGPWHPPLGSVTPLLAAVAGVGVLGWLVWTAVAPAAPEGSVDLPPGQLPEQLHAHHAADQSEIVHQPNRQRPRAQDHAEWMPDG